MQSDLSHHHAHLAGEAPNSLTYYQSIELDLSGARTECAKRREKKELFAAGTRPDALMLPLGILIQERQRVRKYLSRLFVAIHGLDDISRQGSQASGLAI
jgi:hypothetical protein